MKTYSQADWRAAQQAWDDGDFSDEWKPWRHKAAMVGGIIFPPNGTKWDDWGDEHPSQRAMLIRAIRDTPQLLEACLRGAGSWSVVIDRLTRARDEWRAENGAADRLIEQERVNDTPSYRETITTIADILERIWSSR